MPLYDFECEGCSRVHEQVFKMDDCPEIICCPECGARAQKILAVGHGGVWSDTPAWLDREVVASLQDDDLIRKKKVKPIETRTELKRHLKANNLAPVSG